MRKGSKQTAEAKRRMSESKKGKLLGDKNPFYGKTHSEETRIKISEAHKGRPHPMKGKKTGKPAWNRGLKGLRIGWTKGKARSPDSIRKMVETRKKNGSYKHTEEQKRKISLGNKGKVHSKETREKISIIQKRIWANPEVKERMRLFWKGRKHTPEAIQHMKEARKKSYLDPELRMKMSIAMKKRFEDGEIPWNKGTKGLQVAWNKDIKMPELSEWGRKNILKQYESGIFPKQENTKPERQIKEELIKRAHKEGIDFVHQYKFMNKFMCDFCFPKQKVIIEVYGDFWHANPEIYPEGIKLHPHQIKGKRIDKSKEAYISKVDNQSWTYLVLWENDIKREVAKCVDRIEEVLTRKIN